MKITQSTVPMPRLIYGSLLEKKPAEFREFLLNGFKEPVALFFEECHGGLFVRAFATMHATHAEEMQMAHTEEEKTSDPEQRDRMLDTVFSELTGSMVETLSTPTP